MTQRSNAEWTQQLSPPPSAEATAELRERVHRALARALGPRPDVDDADLEDFAQEAVIRVLDRLESFRGTSQFMTWAVAVGVRVALTALRRRKAEAARLERLPERSPQADPAGVVEQSEVHAALLHAMDTALTERQRAAVRGKLAGQPAVVIADSLGMKLNAFYKLDHDARKKLKRALATAGFAPEPVSRLP